MKRFLFLFLFLLSAELQAQKANVYGLKVINTAAEYKVSVTADSNKHLVEIQKYIPDILLDIRYASTNNFVKQAVYKQARAFARLPVVKALKNIQDELKKFGLGLKIFDGYRPYSVTLKFFDIASDKSFVANPKDGSRHNRGCAIDLTLIHLLSGKELKMPTPYDSFAHEASVDFKDLRANIIKNRDQLRNVMERNGFKVLDNEWWHFDFTGWKTLN